MTSLHVICGLAPPPIKNAGYAYATTHIIWENQPKLAYWSICIYITHQSCIGRFLTPRSEVSMGYSVDTFTDFAENTPKFDQFLFSFNVETYLSIANHAWHVFTCFLNWLLAKLCLNVSFMRFIIISCNWSDVLQFIFMNACFVVTTRGGVLEDVLGLEDVLEDTFWSPRPWPRSLKSLASKP